MNLIKKNIDLITFLVILALINIPLFNALPYGEWDWGVPYFSNGFQNVINSEIKKVLQGNFLGFEIVYWNLLYIYFSILKNKFIYFFIFTLEIIAFYGIYLNLKNNQFLGVRSKIIISSLYVLSPFYMTRIIAGHLPILLSISVIAYLFIDKNIKSYIKIIIIIILTNCTAHGLIFIIISSLFFLIINKISFKKYIYINFINCILYFNLILKFFERNSFKIIREGSSTYTYIEFEQRIEHLQSASLSLLEVITVPFRQGMDIIYVFNSQGIYSNLFYFIISLTITIIIIIDLIHKNDLKTMIGFLFLINICTLYFSPLFTIFNLLFNISPNVLPAFSTPSRFLIVLWMCKIIYLGCSLKMTLSRTYYLGILILVAIFGGVSFANNFETKFIDQPLKLVITNQFNSNSLEMASKTNVLILPNANHYILNRDGNPLAWESRFIYKDHDMQYKDDLKLHDLWCKKNFDEINDLLTLKNYSLLIGNYAAGKSYKNPLCNFEIKDIELLKNYLEIKGFKTQIISENSVIFKKSNEKIGN
ncbi:hypothetical protein G6646_00210 [Polynucleobacter paneuropaeus]|nr:hypothetical protein [Polynucleobacter paneuropaeus]